MPSKKIDAIVEAVRYDAAGQIEFVRIYERISSTFADRSLLMRADLVERLKKGQRFVAGQRQELMGATFTTGPDLRLVGGSAVQTTEGSGEGDNLKGVPRI
jgi:hypothetical protein